MIDIPISASASEGASSAFFVVAAIYFALSAVWAVVNMRKLGVLPLVLLAGGLISALQEGPIDRLILLWYPEGSPVIAWHSMGVPQPLYMILIYGGFVGGGSYVAYRSLVAGRGARGLWEIFLGVVVMDALFEIPATAGHVYFYYGNLPFQVVDRGWAVHLGFISASAPVLAGWMLFHIVPFARGGKVWLLALIPPTAWAAAYFVTGWPVYLATGSDWPAPLTWLGGIATIALSCGLVWLLGRTTLAWRGAPVAVATT